MELVFYTNYSPLFPLIIIKLLRVVILIVLYLNSKGEQTVLYKINKNVYIKTSKIMIV